jgi:hypothetical protein
VGLGVVVALVDVQLEVGDDGAAHGAGLGAGLRPPQVRGAARAVGATAASTTTAASSRPPVLLGAVSVVVSSSGRASPLVCHGAAFYAIGAPDRMALVHK